MKNIFTAAIFFIMTSTCFSGELAVDLEKRFLDTGYSQIALNVYFDYSNIGSWNLKNYDTKNTILYQSAFTNTEESMMFFNFKLMKGAHVSGDGNIVFILRDEDGTELKRFLSEKFGQSGFVQKEAIKTLGYKINRRDISFVKRIDVVFYGVIPKEKRGE